jgi:hypothetical protein
MKMDVNASVLAFGDAKRAQQTCAMDAKRDDENWKEDDKDAKWEYTLVRLSETSSSFG